MSDEIVQNETETEDTTIVTQEEVLEVTPLVWEIWAVGEFKPYNFQFIYSLHDCDEIWIKKETQGYAHVVLYIGNGEVIHVADVDKPGLKKGTTEIVREPLENVAEGKLVGLRKTNATHEEVKIIIERANEDVGKFMPYILTTENCEHQVKKWITGKDTFNWHSSTQVRDYIFLASIFGVIGGVGGWAIAYFAISKSVGGQVLGALIGFIGGAVTIAGLKFGLTMLQHRSCLPWNSEQNENEKNGEETKKFLNT